VPCGASRKESLVKRLLFVFMTLALNAAGCGGVKSGAPDGGPEGDHTTDAGGPDGDRTEADGTTTGGPDAGGSGGSSACVLGASELGNCNL
jgi:hypothetical protein